jgi:hypothetical protein
VNGLFEAPPTRSVARSLLVACLWSLALVVVGALALGVVALVALAIATFAGEGDVIRAITAAGWAVAAIAGAVLVWVAAYASTGWGSRRRTVVGVAVGLALGAGYTLLGAELGVVVGMAAGWAVVIPAERMERVLARSVPALLVGVVSLPEMSRLAYGGLIAVAPWIAALLVLVGDAAWTAVTRLRGDEE